MQIFKCILLKMHKLKKIPHIRPSTPSKKFLPSNPPENFKSDVMFMLFHVVTISKARNLKAEWSMILQGPGHQCQMLKWNQSSQNDEVKMKYENNLNSSLETFYA